MSSFDQKRVAHQVAVGVVNRLEPIEIDQQRTNRLALLQRLFDHRNGKFGESPAVIKFGQAVGQCEALESGGIVAEEFVGPLQPQQSTRNVGKILKLGAFHIGNLSRLAIDNTQEPTVNPASTDTGAPA